MDKRMKDIEKFQKYLQRQAPERRTAIDYASDIRQFAAACQKPWRQITLHDIDAFVDQQRHKELSAATIKRRVAALKVFFDFLAEESGDLQWPNPVRFKRHAGKQPQCLPRDLNDERLVELWQVITSPRDRAWFVLMARGGLRIGEVLNLKLDDLLSPPAGDRPARLRVLGKGQKERVARLTADAYAVLEAWLQVRPVSAEQTIFLNQRGQPLSADGLRWLLDRYSQQVGLNVTPHQLRHTFARQVTEAGMPITSLGKLLGHTQVSTTQIYTAGADPALTEAYQQAMTRLGQYPLPVSAPLLDQQPPAPTAPPAVTVPPLPDWDSWLPDLPPGLRQPSLALVQRRVPDWKPELQRRNALHALGELRRFWQWQQNHRPVADLTELRLADLQDYQAMHIEAGHTARTVNRALVWIKTLLQEQADLGQAIDPAVFRLRRLAPGESLPRYLPEADYLQLEKFVYQRLNQTEPFIRLENACFFVLAHSGLRGSECTYLSGQDLDLSGQRLLVRQGKGRKDRSVCLSQTTVQAIRLYLDGAQPLPPGRLWLKPDGQPIADQWLYTHIVALGQASGVSGVTPHRLRHTLATRLLNAGMDITRIQKLLGHQHLSTTQIYAHVQDLTMEADYRQAMAKIERQQMPLSDTPELVTNWPTSQQTTYPDELRAQIKPDHFL